MALSMCPLDIVTLLPLFFLYFWAVVVFLNSLTFSFYFFDIFSLVRSTKEVPTENVSSKKWPVENSEDILKINKKLVTTKIESCDQFLTKIKFSKPGKAE